MRSFAASGAPLAYNFEVDWGDGTVDTVTRFSDANKRHVYTVPGEYTIVISGIMEGFAMHLDEGNVTGNPNPHKDKLLKVLTLGNTGLKDLRYAFSGCANSE